jgi:PAS domain S-box-containing protein
MEDQPLPLQQAGVTIDADLAARAVGAAGDAIVTVDIEGRISSWNPAAEALLGHPASEAVGATLALIIPDDEDFRARHIAGFRAAASSGALAHHGAPAHVRASAHDGQRVDVIMTLGLLTAPGTEDVTGVVAVLRRADAVPVPFVR